MPFVRKPEIQRSQSVNDARKIFIGRTDELKFFVENALKSENPTYNILSISGQGGVGKSTLLARFIDEARATNFKDYCLVAMVDERQVTPAAIMEKFADQLDIAGEFTKALSRYKEALHKLQNERETVREAFWRKTTTDIASSVVKEVPVVGGLLEKGAAPAIEYFMDEIHYRQLLKDAERLENPIEDLTRIFVEELNRLTEIQVSLTATRTKRRQRILLFFDTFEQLASETVVWLLDYFLQANISTNVVLVIAGRDPVDRSMPNDPKRWLPYYDDNIIYSISLDSFTESETIAYLAERNITEPDRVATFQQLSQGLPLYLGLLTSNPQGKVDPTSDVVANFLRWIPEQEQIKRRLALDAALLTRPFNQDDLDAFTYLPEDERTALYNWLVKLPFVRSSQHDGRYSYHNLVQELFSRHLYQRSLKEYNVTRNTLASYYEQLLKKSQTEIGREIYKTAEWLELVLALVSQLFLLSEETSHIAAIEYILNAYRYSQSSKEIVKFLEEITKEKSNSQANADARGCANLLIRYIEANIASREFLEVVNCLLSKVPQEHSSFSELSAYLYVSRGRAYISRREYQLAINDINHAIEIRPNYASAFLHRGQAYRYMNCYEDALNDLEHAINLSEDLVHSGQKEKGNIFLYLKKYQEAINALIKALIAHPNCTECWDTLAETFEISYSWAEVPNRLRAVSGLEANKSSVINCRASAMQSLGHYEEALMDLNRVITIDPNDLWAITHRGQIYAHLKRFNEALTDLNHVIARDPDNFQAIANRSKTYRLMGSDEEALTDLEHAIELKPSNGWVYLNRGQTYRQMGRYYDALNDFEHAIELNAHYEHEGQKERGLTLLSLKRHQEACEAFL